MYHNYPHKLAYFHSHILMRYVSIPEAFAWSMFINYLHNRNTYRLYNYALKKRHKTSLWEREGYTRNTSNVNNLWSIYEEKPHHFSLPHIPIYWEFSNIWPQSWGSKLFLTLMYSIRWEAQYHDKGLQHSTLWTTPRDADARSIQYVRQCHVMRKARST
jgi:hypothetical protein